MDVLILNLLLVIVKNYSRIRDYFPSLNIHPLLLADVVSTCTPSKIGNEEIIEKQEMRTSREYLVIKLWDCCSGYNNPPKFWLTCKFRSLLWIMSSIIHWSLIRKLMISRPLLNLKICSCCHLNAVCVMFSHWDYCFSWKWNVV